MAITVGRVVYLKFGDDYGFVYVRREPPASPPDELLIIWFGDEARGPVGLFTTALTTALAKGLLVRLSHGDDSAYITQVLIEAA